MGWTGTVGNGDRSGVALGTHRMLRRVSALACSTDLLAIVLQVRGDTRWPGLSGANGPSPMI